MDSVPCAARCRLRTGELRVPLRWRLEHLAPLLRYASHWRPTSRASSPTREWPLSGPRGGGGRDGRAERRPAADGGSPPRRPSIHAETAGDPENRTNDGSAISARSVICRARAASRLRSPPPFGDG